VPRFRIKLAKDVIGKSHRGQKRQIKTLARRAVAKSSAELNKIFVGNIPPVVTERDMVSVFGRFGEIESVFVPMLGSVSKGYGFVEFESVDVAQQLLRDQPRLSMGPNILSLRQAKPRFDV
jgi:RNA recognition motif-containing protein